MAMFWTCPYGANHDFGEQCDCEAEKMSEELKQKLFWQQQLHVPKAGGQISFEFARNRRYVH